MYSAPRALVLALTLCATLFSSPGARACHLPEYLRSLGRELTPAQMALLSHHDASMKQIPYRAEQAFSCVDGTADIFPCRNVDLLAHMQLTDIGGGTGNDMWGWVDPLTGTEYALVGRSSGTAFVDVSDPENPVYIGNLPTHSEVSSWRDIKTYADHAFVVADFAGAHGMQVFDLNQLRDVQNPPVTFAETAHYAGFERAHNVVINEATGFAYAVGSESCGGGLIMIDIRDPQAPAHAGCFSQDGYTHDAQCVLYEGPDVGHHGEEICFAANEDTLTLVDVTDKANPLQLSRTGYSGSGYTHQGWLTADQRYFVHDDELDEIFFGHRTRTYVWDVSDLDAPEIAGVFEADGRSIDHNQYIKDGYSYQANYRRGLRVLSLDDPSTADLSEAAFFDTYPEADGDDFDGAWSTYPFFDSGIVLVSDINRGLFILRPNLETLSLSGDCPGATTFALQGQSPGGPVALLRGQPGASTIPNGPCAGTSLDLANPRRLVTLTADGNGGAGFTRNLPPAACGVPFQAVDLTTCAVTNVKTIP